MIAIIGAMKKETDTLISMLDRDECERISGTDFHRGRIGECEVVICSGGIGKVAAAICTEAVILRYNPELIINTGVAGAISRELDICDVVISSDVVQYDMDTSAIGDPVGFVSGVNMIYFPADEKTADKMKDIINSLGSIKALVGTVASGDRFVAGLEMKKAITDNFPGALCCEMEGASIGMTAYVNGVPFVVIRSISDNVDTEDTMDYAEFSTIAAENSVKVVSEFLRSYGK